MARSHTREDVEITEAIAYVRVSTQEQAGSGLGMESQQARIAAYCTAQGWRLVDTYTDAGLSAKTLNRPALRDAMSALRPGRVLLALKLDRLTRTARDLDELTSMVHRTGGEWATVEGSYDTSTAMGRFMLRVVADIAQMEREVTAERTVAALGAKRERRERLGTTPLGYQTVDGEVTEDSEEQATVALARQYRSSGMTLRAIAAQLTDDGCQTKRGGKWGPQTVSLLLSPRYLERIGD